MSQNKLNVIFHHLKKDNVIFEQGLSDKEIAEIEARFKFIFPPDLKKLLQKKLPVSDNFINWRKALNQCKYRKEVQECLTSPVQGMLCDIKNDGFWLQEWGDRPKHYDDQKKVVKRIVAKAPKLIPIMSHSYLPDEPKKVGNPVLALHQTCLTCKGNDLLSYFGAQFCFKIPEDISTREHPKNVRFWSNFVH